MFQELLCYWDFGSSDATHEKLGWGESHSCHWCVSVLQQANVWVTCLFKNSLDCLYSFLTEAIHLGIGGTLGGQFESPVTCKLFELFAVVWHVI